MIRLQGISMGESTKYFLLENMIMIEPERAFVKELFNKAA